jgi:hypothetical protein
VSEIRKLISRAGIEDELGVERKAALRKCSKKRPHRFSILSAKYAVHASLKSVDASRESHDTPPSLSHLEASRAVLGAYFYVFVHRSGSRIGICKTEI